MQMRLFGDPAIIFLGLLCAATGLGAPLYASAPPADSKGMIFFEKKIRPVLVARCYECHSAKSTALKGGLRVDTKDGLRRGGDSGPAIVPGNVEESIVISALRHESFEMPPKGKMPSAIIEDFVAWVKMGAPDPRVTIVGNKTAQAENQKPLWSLHPIQPPPPPRIAGPLSSSTAIDRYILARLEKANLTPSPRADRRTLLRRLYFDLIGLPPTRKDLAALLQMEGPHIWSQAVDRLLARPQFGERWGRHWLDVVRFAESSGGGRTQMFPDAWRFRDYVIQSLAHDKPYNEFLMEQIAGDLMKTADLRQQAERLTAVGFLTLGPTNYELQDKELLRMEVVDEQIDTTGRVFLGLTIGCARCHDHKFDPIPTKDYYALAGIFRSTKTLTPGNVSGWVKRSLPLPPHRQQALDQYQTQTAQLQQNIQRAQKQLVKLTGGVNGAGKFAAPKSRTANSLPGVVVDNQQAKLTGSWTASTHSPYYVDGEYLHDGDANKGASSVVFSSMLPADGVYEVRVSYSAGSNRTSRVAIRILHAKGEATVEVNQRKPPPIDGLFVSLGTYMFQKGKKAEVMISNSNTQGHVIADAVQFLPIGMQETKESTAGSIANSSKKPSLRGRRLVASRGPEGQDQLRRQLNQWRSELSRLKKNAPAPAPIVMAVAEEEKTGDYFVCIRGNVHRLGQPAPRGFLSAITSENIQIAPGASGRMEFAHWLADPQNPLTARVLVNRVWQKLFGEGLAAAEDNFGHMGEPPSHPKLLDYLAAEFIRGGWSIKNLVRQIVLSDTYQRSSQGSEVAWPSGPQAATKIDPENRLLSHANRRRLDAEAIRDAILQFSGTLDLCMGGKTIKSGVTTELGYEFGSYRRSVYTPVFRNTLHPLLEAFDFADPNIVVGDRNTSTLATQGLYLLNSDFVMDQSRLAAKRCIGARVGPNLTAESERRRRVRYLFESALGRPPTEGELRLAIAFLKKSPDELSGWEGVCQMLIGCVDFRYLR